MPVWLHATLLDATSLAQLITRFRCHIWRCPHSQFRFPLHCCSHCPASTAPLGHGMGWLCLRSPSLAADGDISELSGGECNALPPSPCAHAPDRPYCAWLCAQSLCWHQPTALSTALMAIAASTAHSPIATVMANPDRKPRSHDRYCATAGAARVGCAAFGSQDGASPSQHP